MLILLLSVFGVSAMLSAQVVSNFSPIDVFNLEYVSDPQISPDGNQIVYVRNFKDIMTDRNLSNLWIINFDGSNNRPLTTGNQNDSSPEWSHDGQKIVFRSNMADGKSKLYLMWMDTREVFALTNTPLAPSSVSWSPDDRFLAFNMFVPKQKSSIIKMPAKPEGAKWNDPPIYIDDVLYRTDGRGYLKSGNMQLFVLPVEGGTPKQLTFSAFDHYSPSWSQDGQSLYFSANMHPAEDLEGADSDIYSISVTDGTIAQLTHRYGPDAYPIASPNGELIAYLGYNDTLQGYRPLEINLMNADGSNPKSLSEDLDRVAQNPRWSADGKELYFQYDEHGDTKLASIGLSGKVRVIAEGLGGLEIGRPYNEASYSSSHNQHFAFTLGTPEHPSDLAVSDGKTVTRLTALNDDLFSFKKLGKVKELWWKSSYDQLDIQGWVVTPPDFDPNKKYPLILEIHGGPYASYGTIFSSEIQSYAAAGYVVLYCNPRGSTGYGADFANLIHHDYPNHDFRDLMSGVDYMLEQAYIDEENLFVTGGSGGGILTAWIVGKTDRFKAAVAAKPVINWYSFVLNADYTELFYKYWFPAKPWESPEDYLRRSPLSYVGNVKTPTMLLTGEEDYRTPISESEQFYTALKLEGVETALVRIPNSSHHISAKPSNLVAKITAILAWFDKYRTDKKEETETN